MDKGKRSTPKATIPAGYGLRCTRVNIMTSLLVVYAGGLPAIEAYSQNVSYGGMGFYSVSPVTVGKEVHIQIYYTPESNMGLIETITGIVRWCKPVGQWYGAGVEFKDLNPDKQPLLFSYVESALGFHHIQPHQKNIKSDRREKDGRRGYR